MSNNPATQDLLLTSVVSVDVDHAASAGGYGTRSNMCRISGCGTLIRRGLLMCHTHWSKLPRELQTEIYSKYTPGAVEQSAEYMAVVARAVEVVQEQERASNGRSTASAIKSV